MIADPMYQLAADESLDQALPTAAYGKLAAPLLTTWRLVLPSRTQTRPWVAEITGRDPQFKLARFFVPSDISAAGRAYDLRPGRLYEVSDGHRDRYFLVPPRREGEQAVKLSPEEAYPLL